MISRQSTCFKISSGREIQGLDLMASIIGSQWCGINILSWVQALRSMQRVFISWYYKIELPGLQWCRQAPCLGLKPCVPCGGCFPSWYYKIKPYKGRVMWLQMGLGNGDTRLSLIVSSMLSSCYYYLEAKGKVANYFYLVRVTMIALIMRIILA